MSRRDAGDERGVGPDPRGRDPGPRDVAASDRRRCHDRGGRLRDAGDDAGVDWNWAPGWLGSTIAVVGFLAFLLFFGLLSLVGNLAVGALLFALLWRGWGWPPWLAALAAAPFWIAFSSFLPKPW